MGTYLQDPREGLDAVLPDGAGPEDRQVSVVAWTSFFSWVFLVDKSPGDFNDSLPVSSVFLEIPIRNETTPSQKFCLDQGGQNP